MGRIEVQRTSNGYVFKVFKDSTSEEYETFVASGRYKVVSVFKEIVKLLDTENSPPVKTGGADKPSNKIKI